MASIRKRGSSYLLVVSMGYDYEGNRIKPKQKTVHPPEGLTPKQREKWLKEQAVLFERECRSLPQGEVDRSITLAKYTELWLQTIAPGKLAGRPIGKVHLPGFMAAAGHTAGICRRQFLGQCKALCRKGQIGAGHWSVPLRNSVVKAGS